MSLSLYTLFCASCTLGRPPQTTIGRDISVSAWSNQPGVEQIIEREILSAASRQGNFSNDQIVVELIGTEEVPQVYFPEQGTLWQLKIQVEVSAQHLSRPLHLVGQANYLYTDAGAFIDSRQNGYSQAIEQIAQQLVTILSYTSEDTDQHSED